MTLRERLRLLMKRKDLSAKMLAAKAGISVNTLNMYIGYREVVPSADIAVKLARALGVTVKYLVDGTAPNAAYKRDAVFDIASDSGSAEKASLSAFALVIEEIRKTPKESLPALFELVIKFNAEHGTATQ